MARSSEKALTSLEELEVGDIVRHVGDSQPCVVMANYGSRVTAIRAVDLTRLDGWLKITNDNEAVDAARLYPDGNEIDGAEASSDVPAVNTASAGGGGDSDNPFGYRTLRQLFLNGPTRNGDVASQTDRLIAIQRGWVERRDGYSFLTNSGVGVALDFKLDREKEQIIRQRLEAPAASDEKIADLEKKLAGWGDSFARFVSDADDIRQRNEALELAKDAEKFIAKVKELGDSRASGISDLSEVAEWIIGLMDGMRERENVFASSFAQKSIDLERQTERMRNLENDVANFLVEVKKLGGRDIPDFIPDFATVTKWFAAQVQCIQEQNRLNSELVRKNRNLEAEVKEKTDTVLGADATIEVLERNLQEQRASKAQIRVDTDRIVLEAIGESEALRAHLATQQDIASAQQSEIWRLESLVAEKDHEISKLRQEITGHVADVALLRQRMSESASRQDLAESLLATAVRRIDDIKQRVDACVYEPLGPAVIRLKGGVDGHDEPYDVAAPKGFVEKIAALATHAASKS